MLNKTLTVEQLRDMCKDFDESHGTYPEHECEGGAVFSFILQELGIIDDEYGTLPEELDLWKETMIH